MDIQKSIDRLDIEIEELKTKIDEEHMLCQDITDLEELIDKAIMFGDLCAKRDANAQAVPEGFVLVPKLLSDELADELASDAFNNIQSMFDYEHRGSTATHREQIRLRWCRNKAKEYQENYKIVIEAQEQKG